MNETQLERYADAEQKEKRLCNTEPIGYNNTTDENDAELTDELAVPEPHDDSDTSDPDPKFVSRCYCLWVPQKMPC